MTSRSTFETLVNLFNEECKKGNFNVANFHELRRMEAELNESESSKA